MTRFPPGVCLVRRSHRGNRFESAQLNFVDVVLAVKEGRGTAAYCPASSGGLTDLHYNSPQKVQVLARSLIAATPIFQWAMYRGVSRSGTWVTRK